MKENIPESPDEALSKLLHTWKPSPSFPPRFQEGVWRRIHRAQVEPKISLWQQVLTRVEAFLARPALATAYVTVLLLAGLGAGYWHAGDRTARAQSEWRARYVQTVDPFQMPR